MIKIQNLKKSFNNLSILNGVNMTINKGEIYGIIGPNGAGKTTLLNSMIGLFKIDCGSIVYNDKQLVVPYDSTIKNSIGFIPDTPMLLEYLTGYENMSFFSYLYKKKFKKTDITNMLKKFNIAYAENTIVKEYSKGMKQRLMLASLLINNPKIIILDEPTTGLDPISISELKSNILELKNKDNIIIIATHDMDFVENLCDRISIISNGKILIEDTIPNIYIKNNTNSLEKTLVKLMKG